MKKDRYEEPATEAKGFYMFSILRACLDPLLEEWGHTSLQRKVDILKKFLEGGTSLQEMILEYKSFYMKIKKEAIAKHAISGLLELMQYLIKNQEPRQVMMECRVKP